MGKPHLTMTFATSELVSSFWRGFNDEYVLCSTGIKNEATDICPFTDDQFLGVCPFTKQLSSSLQALFGKTCATTQKNVKSHVFLDFEKNVKKRKKRTYSFTGRLITRPLILNYRKSVPVTRDYKPQPMT